MDEAHLLSLISNIGVKGSESIAYVKDSQCFGAIKFI